MNFGIQRANADSCSYIFCYGIPNIKLLTSFSGYDSQLGWKCCKCFDVCFRPVLCESIRISSELLQVSSNVVMKSHDSSLSVVSFSAIAKLYFLSCDLSRHFMFIYELCFQGSHLLTIAGSVG